MGFDFVSFFPRAVMQGIPLLFGSTGEILTEKSGNLNLGIPGIMYVGGISGVIGAFFYEQAAGGQLNGFLAIMIPILCSLLGSLLMGLLYCFLTVTLRANQNVTGLAMTTFGVGVGNFFGGSLIKLTNSEVPSIALSSTSLYFKTTLPGADSTGWFGQLFLSYGFLAYVAIIIALGASYFLNHTRPGLHLRAVGESASTADAADAQTFIDRYVTFSEVNAEADLRQTATAVFLGKTLLLAEGYGECILIDAKSYPSRGVEEPSSGKVLRGAHDGFIETLVQNAALLRRRIRTPQLTLEGHKISEKSRADVVLCYLEDKVDRALLARVRAKLAAIDADSISMSQESIAESMMDQRQWFNPFPRVRYTERPDAATASIMEGSIIVLVDNSPAAMILPTRFFDFVQEANDFYFPPLVGSYLRILRVVVFLLTLFITPVWYLLVQDPDLPNSALSFLAVTSEYEVPILAQLLLTEFIVDLLKLASLNTPSVFSNSFSMIGALVLGDFAVQAHWLVPEVLAYMAFVAIANFAQPSYELGYAFKLLRLVLLVSSAALGWVGLALGTLLIVVLLVTTRPIAGGHYMYPIYPFNWHALRALLIRRPIAPDNT